MDRLLLQTLLESIFGVDRVYFQPPTGSQMKYPCVVYKRDPSEIVYADNKAYKTTKKYEVTVIDGDPDSLLPDRIADLTYSKHVQFFTSDNLNHNVYTLFF